MALSCSYIPCNKQGQELKEFQRYRKELGYETASKVFTQVLSPSFKDKYKKKLTLDSQGVPTYDSAVKVSYVKNLIGTTKLSSAEQKKFPSVANTRENYRRLVQTAQSFNTSSDLRDVLTAVVTKMSDDNIRVDIREKNQQNDDEFKNQYGSTLLNQRLEEIFGNLGVTVDLLEQNEITNGYIDFSKASSIAEGFKGLINIANGIEGDIALSEEFSHLLIGIFRDQPLIQRSLRLLANSDELLQEALGDEYERNRDYYSEHPNYDEEGNEMTLNETLAEEALGKILQEKLKNSTTTSLETPSTPLQNLIQRLINFIKRTFKGRSINGLTEAQNDVNSSLSELAKQILSGEKKITKEDVMSTRRVARFHQVKEDVDKVINLLKNANEVERKRIKIVPKKDTNDVKKRIIELEALIADEKKTEGLHRYAKWALEDLQGAMEKLTISDTLQSRDFTNLRHIKSVIDSYAGFISEFHDVLDEYGEDTSITIGEEEVDLKQLWKDIDDLYQSCITSFKKQSLAAFSDFLAPIYNVSPLKDSDGNIRSLEDVLIGEDFDISEFDRWITSMGTSSSIILQMFDKAVKNAKDKARMKTIDSTRRVWKIKNDAEKRGITTFEWMFEKDNEGHKTGNYISQYNQGQYKKDEKEMLDALQTKYGKHPIGKDFKAMQAEKAAWYEQHAGRDILGYYVPNESYRNKTFDSLSKAQKDTLDDILNYKNEIEAKIPIDRRDTYRAIQRRRGGLQRVSDAADNPKQSWESIKEAVRSTFRRTEDDDQIYGDRTSGLTDFTGKEYMVIPVLFTSRLNNPDELSTDVMGDLMVYADMANTYEEVSAIYDPLEVGVSVLSNKEFIQNKGSKRKEEVINTMGKVTRRNIKIGSNTNFEKKLRDFLECQVYERYLKEDDVIGPNAQKAVGFFQRMTSMAYLGCNWLQGIANVATAGCMQHIEAAASEFFSAKNLGNADLEYGKMMPEFVAELASQQKQSKLALFDELFNVRQNAKDKLKNTQMKSIFRRFFGQNWLFIQQGLGDHWIYNRTAIAMALNRQVLVNGKKMSVWDATEIVTDENGFKKMVMKEGTKNLDGSAFDATKFGREIAHINHTLMGIYNDEDQNAANRVMIGRLALQMRKWIMPQMMRRFQSKRTILDIGKEEEGYYRTAFRFAKDAWKAGFKITQEWDNLSKEEKANCKRAFTEIMQTVILWGIVGFLGRGTKDPDRTWAAKFLEYMANRELHEVGFLTPGPLMLTEGYKTVTSPVVSLSAANKVAQAVLTTVNPFNWFPGEDDLIKSGRYEGHSYIYKRWMELPLPPMTQLRQMDKFFDELDTGTKYYSKDYK